MKQILANIMPEETRLAVVDEEGTLVDLVLERSGEETTVNHIYAAVVRNVLPGMQAAFVDIGQGQNAYLNLQHGKQTKGMGKLFVGQRLMVQVVKEEMLGKSARVTADISLAGRFMVYLPFSSGLCISKKITSPELRDTLKSLAEPYMAEGGSFIIRTAATKATATDIHTDMKYLLHTWQQLQKRFKVAKNGSEIYSDADFWHRILRDYTSDDINCITVDNKVVYMNLLERTSTVEANANTNALTIKLHTERTPIFSNYHIEEQLDLLVNKTVDLASGGFLRFDFTEALTVIDVNSGHYTGRSHTIGETALEVNKEAAVEICRQIKLRDLGGIIICDFIDMPKKEQQNELLALLSKLVRTDRVKTVVCGMTSLGLVEMTRKREHQSLQSLLFDNCDHCGGTGFQLSATTVSIQIMRKLRDLYRAGRLRQDVLIEAHPDVVACFSKSKVNALSEELQKTIKLESNVQLTREAYSLLSLES